MTANVPNRLSIQRIDEGETTTFLLEGTVDEHAKLEQLAVRPNFRVVLHLKGVSRINSVGVKLWIDALEGIPSPSKVILKMCSVPVVSQINMIANFRGRAEIESFYAPYYCEACDIEFKYLFDVADIAGPPYMAPTAKCIRCKGPLVFDDIEADYLQIVAVARQVKF